MNHDELLGLLSRNWMLFSPSEPVPAGSPCEQNCLRYYSDVRTLGGGFQFLCLKWCASDGKEAIPLETRAFFAFGLRRADAVKLAAMYDIPSILVHDERGLREVCMKAVPSPEGSGEFLYLPGDTINLLSPVHRDSFTVSDARSLLFGSFMRPVTASLQGGKMLQNPGVYFVEPPRPGCFHRAFHVWPVL